MPVLPQRERGGGEAGTGGPGVWGAARRAPDAGLRQGDGTLRRPPFLPAAPGSRADQGRATRRLAARHTCTRRRPAFVAEPRAAAAGLGLAEELRLPAAGGRASPGGDRRSWAPCTSQSQPFEANVEL